MPRQEEESTGEGGYDAIAHWRDKVPSSVCRLFFRSRSAASTLITAGAITLAIATSAAAAPGDLDTSFGQGGHAIVQLNERCLNHCARFMGSYADALAVEGNGGIVLGGWESPGPAPGQPQAALARLDSDGTVDQSFAMIGPASRAAFRITHLYLLPAGDVLALGEAEDGRVGLERYSASGQLDPSFGSSGLRFLDTPPGTVQEARDAAGRIDVLARSATRIIAMRFLPSGALDRGFGVRGVSSLPTARQAEPIALTTVQGGGVVLAISIDGSSPAAATKLLVARLTPAGRLARWFGHGGFASVPIARPVPSAVIAVEPSQRIDVATGEDPGPGGDLVLLRYMRSGRLDRSFGIGGVAHGVIPGVEPSYGSVNARAITLDGRGDVIVAGERHFNRVDSRRGVGFLARYTPSGRDCSFGSAGVVSDSEVGAATATELEPDGRILIAGWSNNAFLAARYEGGGTPHTCAGEPHLPH